MTKLIVLVVEDKDIVSKMLKNMIEAMGHVAVTVCSGEAALEHLCNFHVDVLLTDIALGMGLSGIELVTAAGTRVPPVVVLMSGSPAPDNLPINTFYLGKPFTWPQLEQILHS